MLVVRVDLDSAITGEAKEIARVEICNVGGGVEIGHYAVKALTLTMENGVEETKGKVMDHPRLEKSVLHLVAKALNAMGYGK